MLFYDILDEVNEIYPSYDTSLKEGGWSKIVDYLAPYLKITIDELVSVTKAIFLCETFQHSKGSLHYFNLKGIVICCYRISPFDLNIDDEKSIYHKDKELSTHNGLHIMADLFTSHYMKNQPIPCGISIKLEISGYEAREAFKKMYTNYRRIVELLLNKIDTEFCTHVVIDSIEKYRGKDIMKKLDLYYAEEDMECCFWFECDFFQDTEDEVIIRSFLVLSILYDACLRYITKRKDYDRLLGHFIKMGTFWGISKG